MSQVRKDAQLQYIPPELRNSLQHLLDGVFRAINGASKTAKELRTILSRKLHFLWFCKQHGLLEFLFSVKTVGNYKYTYTDSNSSSHSVEFAPTTEALNLVLSCYALYLATGNTIYSQSIKSSTIGEYLRAAADLVSKVDPIPGRDARKTETGDMFEGISKILKEVKRIESVPNRREGYTIAMHRRFYQKIQFNTDLDCFLVVLFDWFTVALQLGLRRSKYSQGNTSGHLHIVEMSKLNTPKAFILDDVEFYTSSKQKLNRKAAIKNPSIVAFVRLRFRWQKNGNHGIYH